MKSSKKIIVIIIITTLICGGIVIAGLLLNNNDNENKATSESVDKTYDTEDAVEKATATETTTTESATTETSTTETATIETTTTEPATTETEITDYDTILTNLRDNGQLPTDMGMVSLELPSNNVTCGDINYKITDINMDGNDELVIYDDVSEYPLVFKLYVYGYNTENNKVEYKFSADVFEPEFYDNGYIVCGFNYGQVQSYTCYKYNSETSMYQVDYQNELFICEAPGVLTTEEFYSQDFNGNQLVLVIENEDGTTTIVDDDYQEWFESNVNSANKLELDFDDVKNY